MSRGTAAALAQFIPFSGVGGGALFRRSGVERATALGGLGAGGWVAWAPTGGIDRVEGQVAEGPWQRATLGPSASEDTWVQWWFEWDAKPGRHRLRARAVDGDGRTQTADVAPPAPDGATGLHTIEVSVG